MMQQSMHNHTTTMLEAPSGMVDESLLKECRSKLLIAESFLTQESKKRHSLEQEIK